jgi:hypothetical protein
MNQGVLRVFFTNFLSVCLFFILGHASAQPERPVGINLSPVSDFSTEFVFTDAFKQSRAWISHNADGSGPWDTGISIPANEHGYPLSIPYEDGVNPAQSVRALVLWDLVDPFPTGTYRLVVEGEGQVTLEFGASGTFQCPVDTLVSIQAASAVRIDVSDEANPISKIRLIRPGYIDAPNEQTFTDEFLGFLEDFQVIRFMDWMQTNNSPLSQWADRTHPETYTQTLNTGVAYEYMVELANLVEKDIWINIPHLANDEFIVALADFLQENLDDDLRIYLEYSNELWNGIFLQSAYASEMGNAIGFTGPSWEQGWKYTAYRSAQVFSLFNSVFTEDDRLVKVIPSQSANPWLSEQMINYFEDQIYNPEGIEGDALAIAPYFASDVANEIVADGEVNSISIEEIVERMAESLSGTAMEIVQNQNVAEQAGLGLIAYEGGQHLLGTGGNENLDALTQKLTAANRHPDLQQVYCDYFDSWYGAGGELFAHFNSHYPYSKWGSWGIKETMEDVTNPKYLALQTCVFQANSLAVSEGIPSPPLMAYPNPFQDRLLFEKGTYDQVFLTDMYGKRVAISYDEALGGFKTAHLAAGMYLLHFEKSNTVRSVKVVKGG